ncbi:MAG: metal ABC transporter substrate-binding protein [Actinomycetota bacterium]
MRSVLGLLVALVLLVSCGGADAGGSGGTRVVGSLYPLAWAAGEVAGGRAEVTNLAPPGVEPHDLELDPGQVRELAEADLVVYLGGGFQPGVEDVAGELDGSATLDVLEGRSLLAARDAGEAGDPHLWLDPTLMAEVATAIGERLADIDPASADLYEWNARELGERLDELDAKYRTGLGSCMRDELIVSHEAFGYLTERYGLEQVGIAGLDPEAEPEPGRVAQVAELARERGVTTIFFERELSPEIAETIASEVGVNTAVLDPIEFPPENGEDYWSIMRANLAAIRRALDCDG